MNKQMKTTMSLAAAMGSLNLAAGTANAATPKRLLESGDVFFLVMLICVMGL